MTVHDRAETPSTISLKQASTIAEIRSVRLQVRKQSRGRQVPWESTSLEDVFYFDGSGKPLAGNADANAKLEEFLTEKGGLGKNQR